MQTLLWAYYSEIIDLEFMENYNFQQPPLSSHPLPPPSWNVEEEEKPKERRRGGGGKRSGASVKLSTDPQSVAARERRHRISDRFRVLKSLVPGGSKMDTVSMLEEAIHYVKFLKTQIWLHQAAMVEDTSILSCTSDHFGAASSQSILPLPTLPEAAAVFSYSTPPPPLLLPGLPPLPCSSFQDQEMEPDVGFNY